MAEWEAAAAGLCMAVVQVPADLDVGASASRSTQASTSTHHPVQSNLHLHWTSCSRTRWKQE